ncbi:inositol monophosphatase family protein [Macrococcus sp. DPC7161]|uniref:inositol monophosphatase family protein n=1 Tax=Macrococcus sp. DPC7161 TaxID=2507060 RepID=UPI00100A50C7|nr:inositol monophosphatase family protein [Macrococcus sp. DPC7161]RXK18858.1 inositol monophosphatase family protein [Macrococcus sp. DPC7161]
MDEYLFLLNIIKEAGHKIRQDINKPLNINAKSNPNDLVTNMDKSTELFLTENILRQYPDHKIIGEEGQGKYLSSLDGTVWIIDPIDGTLNFIHQKSNFAISIGIFKDGHPYAGAIYDVMNNNLYHVKVGEEAYINETMIPPLNDTQLSESIISCNPNWLVKPVIKEIYQDIILDSRSARSYGSAALDFMYVALGKTDAYLTLRLHPWDYAAGLMIVEAVGGIVTNQLNESLNPLYANSILVANKALHHEIITKYLNKHQDTLQKIHTERFSKG